MNESQMLRVASKEKVESNGLRTEIVHNNSVNYQPWPE
jgi:hypothetical protein